MVVTYISDEQVERLFIVGEEWKVILEERDSVDYCLKLVRELLAVSG